MVTGDKMQMPKIIFHPIISSIQKVVLYETKARFYLVGSNNTQTQFRVLKIDRTEPRELIVIEDKVKYSQKEIQNLLTTIDGGNIMNKGLSRTVSAFGIVGFVRFLEGYYIILITKRRRVALIGHHTVYKIEDVSMTYIPNDGVRVSHPDEQRYIKMFQNIDLFSNFYFSYSYDLTHTLQYNLAPVRRIAQATTTESKSASAVDSPEDVRARRNTKGAMMPHPRSTVVETVEEFSVSLKNKHPDDWQQLMNAGCKEEDQKHSSEQSAAVGDGGGSKGNQKGRKWEYGVRNKPDPKYVWNSYLFQSVERILHPDWILYIIHGFVDQSNISSYGRPLYLTLIARRSNRFAGTRFLKRGANFEGDVANEVETEQIVHDASVSSLTQGHYTSFVQLRGSIPAHWGQDISKMVPKPPIIFNLTDPFGESAGKHFSNLLKCYGSPVIILNLAKKREKKRRESLLSEEFYSTVTYLNQFLPPEHHIQYISFDMARINKLKEANVMARLADIAYSTVKKTGIFCSQNPYYWHSLHLNRHQQDLEKTQAQVKNMLGKLIPEAEEAGIEGLMGPDGWKQTGVSRVNCVDCLDRTNTAQFALGKCALAFQLYALGVIDSPHLDFDTDCVRMLEELYEDHGDTLALQYGGSQLVHRIKTYRKTAPWTSQGNDIMQTLRRYYSNTLSDADKQHTMNLFLGVFVPEENKPAIWEHLTDYYLHHSLAVGKVINDRNSYTQWWDSHAVLHLPLPYNEMTKTCSGLMKASGWDEHLDSYFEYYKPYELTVLEKLFSYTVNHSIRDFMPNFTTDYSPFTVRVRPGKRREEMSSKSGTVQKNPSVSGQCSTSSTTSSTSSTSSSTDSEDTQDDDHGYNTDNRFSSSEETSSGLFSFESVFPSMKHTYGVEIQTPRKADINAYKRYVNIGRIATRHPQPGEMHCMQQSNVLGDISMTLTNPVVSKCSRDIYKEYVQRGKTGATTPHRDIQLYQQFVANLLAV